MVELELPGRGRPIETLGGSTVHLLHVCWRRLLLGYIRGRDMKTDKGREGDGAEKNKCGSTAQDTSWEEVDASQ